MLFDLTDLRLFIFVAELKSLTRAAERLIVTASCVQTITAAVLVTLAVPAGLVIAPRTRRFGLYMLVGMATTALVIVGVSAVVLWYLVNYQS